MPRMKKRMDENEDAHLDGWLGLRFNLQSEKEIRGRVVRVENGIFGWVCFFFSVLKMV